MHAPHARAQVRALLSHGMMPVLHGDAVFDDVQVCMSPPESLFPWSMLH